MNKTNHKIQPIQNPECIINYFKMEKFKLIWITIGGIGYNAGMLAGPIYQGKLIDSIKDTASLSIVIKTAILFVASIIIVQIFRYIKRLYVRQLANDVSATMRTMLYNAIVHKPRRELVDENMGSLMTKAISDVDACSEGMRKFTAEVFDTGVLLISNITLLFIYDVKITAIACIFIPVAMGIASVLKKMIYRYTHAYRKQIGNVSQLTYDRIDNAIIYRIYSREKDNLIEYEKALKAYEKKAIMATIWENALQPIYNMITMIGIIVLVILGGNNVYTGTWSIGMFSTYLTLFTAMAFKASKAAKLFNFVQKAQVSWRRIKPYMEEYKVDTPPDSRINDILGQDTKCTLSVKKLCFAYPNSDQLLKNINLSASSGDMIGVTGPVACGKTTLGRQFLCEYPYEGQIMINGIDIATFNISERASFIAYLGHDPQLMSDTIYNNITLGVDGDITNVLKIVCLDQEVDCMENGIHTIVGNGGVRLSGGQQARIALARTLYHKVALRILDDPFSAVDVATEKQILENMKDYDPNAITIIISHRLDVFSEMKQVLVMHKDGTCEYGDVNTLRMTSKLYRELEQLQQKDRS